MHSGRTLAVESEKQVECLIQPDNVYVEVSKSGKLTSDHFKIWLKNDFFPNVESRSLLLIDSLTGHCSDAVKSVKPSDKEVEVIIIPKETTGNIQPIDVFGFRVGYILVVKSDTFENPVKFAFGDDCKSHCDIPE
ncbi:hypothetical protein PV326_000689, partial [Microctonus aethiopoides]